jgi:hypothetical protein
VNIPRLNGLSGYIEDARGLYIMGPMGHAVSPRRWLWMVEYGRFNTIDTGGHILPVHFLGPEFSASESIVTRDTQDIWLFSRFAGRSDGRRVDGLRRGLERWDWRALFTTLIISLGTWFSGEETDQDSWSSGSEDDDPEEDNCVA